LSNSILQTCKELIEDAKKSCADLVFKEFCLDILSKARNVLSDTEFNRLVAFASGLIEGEHISAYQPHMTIKN
jgi:hypothetical protein